MTSFESVVSIKAVTTHHMEVNFISLSLPSESWREKPIWFLLFELFSLSQSQLSSPWNIPSMITTNSFNYGSLICSMSFHRILDPSWDVCILYHTLTAYSSKRYIYLFLCVLSMLDIYAPKARDVARVDWLCHVKRHVTSHFAPVKTLPFQDYNF